MHRYCDFGSDRLVREQYVVIQRARTLTRQEKSHLLFKKIKRRELIGLLLRCCLWPVRVVFCDVLMVCEMSANDDSKLVGVELNTSVDLCEILLCFLTLDFVTVKYFPVVYVALRHFVILFIFLYTDLRSCSEQRK